MDRRNMYTMYIFNSVFRLSLSSFSELERYKALRKGKMKLRRASLKVKSQRRRQENTVSFQVRY